jgi:hypothetical protein
MKKAVIWTALTLLSISLAAEFALGWDGITVVPFEFDPYGTHLVAAEWKGGLGCPTNATTAPFLPPDFSTVGSGSYTDPACPNGDPWDKRNEGLLLAKTGPTNNDASAGATIEGVKGIILNELGYDLRKPGNDPSIVSDPRGSHCGAGAPRFNITIAGNLYFIGCASPPPDMDTPVVGGMGWQRLRWGGSTPLLAFSSACPSSINPCDIKGKTVDQISIIFDEGQDTGPDNFGLAVLDNIDVNSMLVGRGARKADEDEGGGEDADHDNFQSHDSPSHPESSGMEYHDRSKGMNVQSVNGVRSITYNGTCVNFAGDALLNGNPGYVFTFAACDLSALGTGIGNFSITITGPIGFLYQKAAALISGYVSIHPH